MLGKLKLTLVLAALPMTAAAGDDCFDYYMNRDAAGAVVGTVNAITAPPPAVESPVAVVPVPELESPAPIAVAVVPAPVPVATPVAPAAAAPRPAAPPRPACESLDLKDLLRRVRDTAAIGMFTKLALAGEVQQLGVLVNEWKAAGRPADQGADLQRQFDAFIAKVADKVRGGDPQLASDMMCNRARAWTIVLERDFDI